MSPRVCQSLCSPHTGITNSCFWVQLLGGHWGSELRSSCLYNKYFTPRILTKCNNSEQRWIGAMLSDIIHRASKKGKTDISVHIKMICLWSVTLLRHMQMADEALNHKSYTHSNTRYHSFLSWKYPTNTKLSILFWMTTSLIWYKSFQRSSLFLDHLPQRTFKLLSRNPSCICHSLLSSPAWPE